VAKVLSKEPAGRFRTADQLGRVLQAYRSSSAEETGWVDARTRVEPPTAAPSRERLRGAPGPGQRRYQPPAATVVTDWDPSPEERRPPVVAAATAAGQGRDWAAVILGVLALLSLLGLIPLWYLIYLRYAGT
jgi:hypothetical protein